MIVVEAIFAVMMTRVLVIVVEAISVTSGTGHVLK